MTSFLSIPYDDIVYFLSLYGQDIPPIREEAYNMALALIENNPEINTPIISILDFIIAYNLANQGIKFDRYKTSTILFTHDKDLKELATFLTLSSVDKERIIRILGYLNVLDNDMSVYDRLPIETLRLIAMNLDCKSIGLFCNISTKFNKFCESGELDSMLMEKLQNSTKLVLSEYNKNQLIFLCLKGNKKNISIMRGNQSMILNNQGNVYSFGANDSGQLGLGDQINRTIPTLISGITNITEISTGGGGYPTNMSHTLSLDNKGNVYSFGFNNHGQLGLGTNPNRQNMGFAVTINPNNQNMGFIATTNRLSRLGPRLGPRLNDRIKEVPVLIDQLNYLIPEGYSIRQISAGNQYSLILDTQGNVYSFGINRTGKLGLGVITNDINIPTLIPGLNNIIQISAGVSHSLCLDNQGQVYSFGNGADGGLGLNTNKFIDIPTLIPGLNNIVQISAGYHSLCLNDSGQVYSFGNNRYGQLGLGDMVGRKVPTLIPNLYNIVQISAGGNHSLLLNNYGYVYSFGSNSDGELGLGDVNDRNIPTLIDGLHNIIEISAGGSHSIALNAQGNFFAFGNNQQGQLGLGDNNNRNTPTLIPNFNISH